MKNPKLGDYLLWEGKPAKIIAETDQRMVIIELLENKLCPHCSGDLGKNQIHIIPTSPLFQQNAECLPTMKDNYNPELNKISSKNYGDDGVGLSNEQIDNLI